MEVHFFEKPGCINNTIQKKLLEEKGHVVISYNILQTDWSAEELLKYFKGIPLEKCLNGSAPRIKSGDFKPKGLSEEAILKAMLNDRYLIKRPLLKVNNAFGCGFDSILAQKLLRGDDVSLVLSCPQVNNNCD